MKLEAKDRKNPNLICVATIADINNKGELLIHFDGWTSAYDYWCKPDSTDIHPVGWCEENQRDLQSPYGKKWIVPTWCSLITCSPGYIGTFIWEKYLSANKAVAAPEEVFVQVRTLEFSSAVMVIHSNMPQERAVSLQNVTAPTCFKAGMKLEAKDRKNPNLICVATIADINSKGELLIHFDGWTSTYDYWCKPDTTDIHPAGWCAKNNKSLQAPKGQFFAPLSIQWNLRAKDILGPTIVSIVERVSSSRMYYCNGNSYFWDYEVSFMRGCLFLGGSFIEGSTVYLCSQSVQQSWSATDPTQCFSIQHFICSKMLLSLGYSSTFNWNKYLSDTSSVAAPEGLFTVVSQLREAIARPIPNTHTGR